MNKLPKAEEKVYSIGYIQSVERTAFIRMKGIPDINDPAKWAVMLESRSFQTDGSSKTYEIARIDNYHENKPTHLHRFFEKDDPEEDMRHLSFEEAREYLDDNSEKFMKKFF